MHTSAQNEASRANAQHSTGPRTAAGKERSSQNASTHRLFTNKNCIQPHELDEYREMSNAIWVSVRPVGPLEEMLATEIVRAAWRLRRCATVEFDLAIAVADRAAVQNEAEPLDPMHYADTARTQAAVDRARVQAFGIQRRAMADLSKLQTERFLRIKKLPETANPAHFGLASIAKLLDTNYGKDFSAAQNEPEHAAQNEANIARNAPCPCGSGDKYKRCCGKNAPPVLHNAA